MKNIEIDITNLENAIDTLSRGMEILNKNANSDIIDMLEDSCIKRFEYTLEISWKLMKRILKKVYGKDEKELTVNNIFRLSQGYGFIENWESWKDYYEKRNNTAHEYSLLKSKDLLKLIPQFLIDVQNFKKSLEKSL